MSGTTDNCIHPSTDIAPVALFIFNRPDKTAVVLEKIRQAKPTTILVVADGPRPGKPGEKELCDQTRQSVLDALDWNPRVLTNFSQKNLGCRERIASGLSWVFEQVPEAIILEDDCVPDISFFRFASELLVHYRDNLQIGVISGDNFQPQPMQLDASYYFSLFNHCWGWASWRRAWQKYDDKMTLWPRLRNKGWLEKKFPKREHSLYWAQIFDAVHARRIDTWDYPWLFSLWSAGMLTALPRCNLVTNIGVGGDSTHMKGYHSEYHHLSVCPIDFPLVHPLEVTTNTAADLYSQIHIFGEAKLKGLSARLKRVWRKIQKTLR